MSTLLVPTRSFMRHDRFRPIDFTYVDTSARRVDILAEVAVHGTPASPEVAQQHVSEVEILTTRIGMRGGEVVFLQLPRCGDIRLEEERRYPRGEYWDRLQGMAFAHALSSDDLLAAGIITCPDGSHVDITTAPRLTRILAEAVLALLSRS